jgi:hypothetical protein
MIDSGELPDFLNQQPGSESLSTRAKIAFTKRAQRSAKQGGRYRHDKVLPKIERSHLVHRIGYPFACVEDG